MRQTKTRESARVGLQLLRTPATLTHRPQRSCRLSAAAALPAVALTEGLLREEDQRAGPRKVVALQVGGLTEGVLREALRAGGLLGPPWLARLSSQQGTEQAVF